MAKLNIEVEYLGVSSNIKFIPNCEHISFQNTNTSIDISSETQQAILNVANIVNVNNEFINLDNLISKDYQNDLKLGSDKKLLSQPPDMDFLAYYILKRG